MAKFENLNKRRIKRILDREFNALIREKGFCEWCGSSDKQLHASHVKPKGRYGTLRYDILNVLCLCAYCHKWVWHEDPLKAVRWFKNKYPERHEYLLKAKNIQKKMTTEDYKKIRQAVKDKDLDKLVMFPDIDTPKE